MAGKRANIKKSGIGKAVKNALALALKKRKEAAKAGEENNQKESASQPNRSQNLLPNLGEAESQFSSPALDSSGKQIPFPAPWPASPAIAAKRGKRRGKRIKGPITRDMMISDIAMTYPDTLPVLIAYGLHCIGCSLSAYDTLESGCKLHGFDDETIDNVIDDMNHALAKKMKEEKKG